jgi:hypothetical protein
MTELLQRVIAELEKLPQDEQDAIASIVAVKEVWMKSYILKILGVA